jgi:hypothetical protein
VAYIYNTSFAGGISKRITVQGQPGQKYETLCEKITESKKG